MMSCLACSCLCNFCFNFLAAMATLPSWPQTASIHIKSRWDMMGDDGLHLIPTLRSNKVKQRQARQIASSIAGSQAFSIAAARCRSISGVLACSVHFCVANPEQNKQFRKHNKSKLVKLFKHQVWNAYAQHVQ